jgi:hypothetical protein
MLIIERMHSECRRERDSYARQVEMLETGVMRTHTNKIDTTAESLADARLCLAGTKQVLVLLVALAAKHGVRLNDRARNFANEALP